MRPLNRAVVSGVWSRMHNSTVQRDLRCRVCVDSLSMPDFDMIRVQFKRDSSARLSRESMTGLMIVVARVDRARIMVGSGVI
jgi:hypothetical protein